MNGTSMQMPSVRPFFPQSVNKRPGGQAAFASGAVHGVISATKTRVGHEGVKGNYRMDFTALFWTGFGRFRTAIRVSFDPSSAELIEN